MLIAKSETRVPDVPIGSLPVWQVETIDNHAVAPQIVLAFAAPYGYTARADRVTLDFADAAALGRALVVATTVDFDLVSNVAVFTLHGQVVLVDLTDPENPTIAARVDVTEAAG